MDSYQALRRDLETFAKELSIKNFQALSPGLGIGSLAQKSNPKERAENGNVAVGERFGDQSLGINVSSLASSAKPVGPHSLASHMIRSDSFTSNSFPNNSFTTKTVADDSFSPNSAVIDYAGNKYVGEGAGHQKLNNGQSTRTIQDSESAKNPMGMDRGAMKRSPRSMTRSTDRSQMNRGLNDQFIARPMDLGSEVRQEKNSVAAAPWWAWLIGHFVDLLVVCLCLAVCAYGISLMVPEFRNIKFLKIAPALWVAALYGTLIFYTLIFKILGIPLMGSLIRRGFTSHQSSNEKVSSSI